MKFIICVFSTLLAIYQPYICMAAEQTVQPIDLALEVHQMSKSLEDLNQLLRSQQSKNEDFQKLQAAISYLSFRSRSIEMKQYDLRFKKQHRDSLEKRIEEIEDNKDEWDKIDKTFQVNKSVNTSNARPSDLRVELIKGRLKTLDEEISQIEFEIQNAQDELREFELYVQDKLGLIQ